MDAFDAMNAVLRNFKSIPCPSGDSCSTPHCQWKHPWDTEPAATVQPKTTITEDDTDGGGPRKRQRVDGSSRDNRPKSRLNSEIDVTSAKRSVSPPPLKRRAANQLTQTPVKHSRPAATTPSSSTPVNAASHSRAGTATSGTSRTPISAPASVNPSPAVKQTPKKAPRKPESLNPRHLKTSPATHEFRYKALVMLHKEFVRLNSELKKDASDEEEKLVLNDQELIWLALDIEEHTAVDKPPIYSNIIKNRITSYKRMSVAVWRDERLAELKKEAASTMQTPKGPLIGPPRVVDTGLTREQEVALLRKILTPITGLAKHNYVPVAPTDEALEKARLGEEASKGWEVCDRCATRFQVFPGRREADGALTGGGTCTYHPGRKMRSNITAVDIKQGNRGVESWLCCKEDVGSSRGCTKSNTHVFKTTDSPRLSLVMPYMETPANPSAPTDRAVCFDCEMGYTVKGFELIRLTATNWPDGEVILDVLVQPIGEILDFNSRYSGVWPEDFANAPLYTPEEQPSPPSEADQHLKEGEVYERSDAPATTPLPIPTTSPLQKVSSPFVARRLLFSLISPSTPLIGHAIENDLTAVRVIHPTIIDTVLLYPHSRGGLPMRNGLKMLMRQQLNRDIQVDTADQRGHDSAEDARAAGELVRLKVMNEWKRLKGLGWRVEGTDFKWPGWKGAALTEAFIEKGNGEGEWVLGEVTNGGVGEGRKD